MKIAMLGHKRIPSREGGVEVVVEELATRMVQQGHEVVAYNRKGKHVSDERYAVAQQKEYKGVRIISVPTIEKKGLNALVYSFFATIKAVFGRYDVIHYHAEGSCAMLWIPKIFGVRIIATIHGLDWQRAKWGGFATKYLLFGEKIAAKRADEVIVLSKNMQRYFMETYQRETRYIPNGLVLPEPKEASEITKIYGLGKEDYILFLARIVPEKGVHYLIEAFRKTDTDKKLVIAGGASHTAGYYQKIKEMAKKDKRIIMTGFVQGELLEELYSNCCLYVLPSDIEGMPISLLEAMGYGRCCLISDIPENTELAGEFARTFQHGDAEDLRIQLEDFLQKKDYDGSRSRKYVEQNFHWDYVVEQTLKLYEK